MRLWAGCPATCTTGLRLAEVKSHTEVELKFQVPTTARPELVAELARGLATHRTSLVAMYLDTDDWRLAKAGLAWRLRREGRCWIQTLKAGGTNALERFEHEVVRPGASHDASAHANTPPGDKLITLLRRAQKDGVEPGIRFQTEVRRTTRRVRTRGAVVEVAFDEGRLVSNNSSQRIREIEFELTSGSAAAMLELVERWRRRFGLLYEPRSKAERGHRLAKGSPSPPLRKASPLRYSDEATATEAFGHVIDECLAQMTRNAVGLVEGDPALRVEHVHQLRVGIRRLRSALLSFRSWVSLPSAELVEALRAVFATLGRSRDSDVLDSGVVTELAKVGAPPLSLSGRIGGPDPAEVVGSAETQQMFLGWITWRAVQVEPQADPASSGGEALPGAVQADGQSSGAVGAPAESKRKQPEEMRSARSNAQAFRRNAERRLRRWHARIVVDWNAFDELDEAGLHALRKRIKRQRYAVEFFEPVLRRRKVQRYLKPLTAIQERMGELNDLFVARAKYEALVVSDPAAWFALGWLTARIAAVRALAKPELGRLLGVDPPTS